MEMKYLEPCLPMEAAIYTALEAQATLHGVEITDELEALWQVGLQGLTLDQIERGIVECIKEQKWKLPTPAIFREHARNETVDPLSERLKRETREDRMLEAPEMNKAETRALFRGQVAEIKRRLQATVGEDHPYAPEKKHHGHIRCKDDTDQAFVMWRDSQGRDYVHFPGHTINSFGTSAPRPQPQEPPAGKYQQAWR